MNFKTSRFLERASGITLGGAQVFGLATLVLLATIAVEARAKPPASAKKGETAATVNGRAVEIAEVRDAVTTALQGREVSADIRSHLEAEALSQMIDRVLVEQALSAESHEASSKDVDAAMAKLKTQLEGQKLTLDKFLADRHLTLEAFRRQVAWQLLWERAMQKNLTDEVLEAYFKAHHKDFDGTEVRASHILLRPARSGDPAAAAALMEEAAQLRKRIEQHELSFAEAARKFSSGPSREKDGDIGFFPRHGLMVEPFAQAAFALESGQISPPVATPFGVHLILVTGEAPGEKKWRDVREQLKSPAAQALFSMLAAREREKAKIKFSGAMAHIDPKTKEFVPADKAKD